MIIGLGTDLVRLDRIENLINSYGQQFLDRTFTHLEQHRSNAKKNRIASYATRFAAKEACAKALGTGIGEAVRFKDIEVQNLPSGQPTLVLSGPGYDTLMGLVPDGYTPFIHLSLSDEDPLAMATVLIEARPKRD